MYTGTYSIYRVTPERERSTAGRQGRAGGMKCGVASRYCRRLQIKYPISLFGTNQPIHSAPFLPLSPAPHRVPFCNVNLVHNLHASQRLRLITTASVCGRVRECCTSTMATTTTTMTTTMMTTTATTTPTAACKWRKHFCYLA